VSDRPEDQPGWAMPTGGSAEPPPPPPPPPPGPPPAAAPSTPGTWESWNDPAPSGGWETPARDVSGWGPPTSPSPPTVPSPAAAAGAPRQPRGRGWLVMLVVALGVILALAVAGTVLFVTRTLPPYNGAKDFLHDVAQREQTSAESRLCAADSAHPVLTLAGVDRSIDRADAKTLSANPLGVDRSGSTATVTFTVTYNGGKSTETFGLPMTLENGTWKACPSVS